MRLAVVSHKICRFAENSPSGYATDGGFPKQMKAISELFSETRLVVPCENAFASDGMTALDGNNLKICPLSVPQGSNLRRKLAMFGWLLKNAGIIWREVRAADAVHTPIPGDVGTIGILFAWLLKKPLFVRHCGNWLAPKTTAEHIWRIGLERLAGGQNVVFATGGSEQPPSRRNSSIKWIFSTSLSESRLSNSTTHILSEKRLKLITACRLEKRKGVEIVIESLPLILKKFPFATLDIVGGGSQKENFEKLAARLNVREQVNFHGKVAPEEVLERLTEADLFCYPTASEGFPKVVLEALAGGLPVITTAVSVLPQLIGEKNGKVLEAANAQTLAEAVFEICADENVYRLMSENAIQTAKQYSIERWREFIGENLRAAWRVKSLNAIVG